MEAIKKEEKRAIPIRTHEKLKAKENQALTTLDLIRSVLNERPQEGFSVDEMRKRFKVLDKVDELHVDSTVLELSEGEFQVLSQLTKNYKWGMLDKFILEFADSLS